MTFTLLAQNYSHNNSLHDETPAVHESRDEPDWWNEAQYSGVEIEYGDYNYTIRETENERDSRYRLLVIMLTIRTWVGVISLLCNVYFLVILMRDRSLKATLRTIFVTLTVNDLVLLIVFISTRDTQIFSVYTFLAMHIQSLGSTCISVLYDASTVFLITMAVHQYLDVAKKHFFSRHVTLLRVRIALVAIYFVCIVYRTPQYFATEIVHFHSIYYMIVHRWFDSSEAYVIFKIFSIVTFELIIPFSSLAFITVQLKRSASTQSSDRNASRDTPSFSFDLIVTAVIFAMAIAGCICLPLRHLFPLTEQMHLIGYHPLYFDHHFHLLQHLIYTVLQAFTAFKLVIYHVARRRITGISWWCSAENQYDSFSNTDQDEPRSLDTIILVAPDNCSNSDKKNEK